VEWDWSPKHDMTSMTADMIKELSSRKPSTLSKP